MTKSLVHKKENDEKGAWLLMTLIKWSGQAAPAPTVRRRRQPVPAENTHLLLSDHGDRRVDRVQALAQAVGVHGGGVEDLQGGALGRGGRGVRG